MAADMSVEVQGDDIVVTLPGTSYVVTYYRAAAFPQQLLTKSHSGREDEDAPMTQAEFHARAWIAATPRRASWGGLCKFANRKLATARLPSVGYLIKPSLQPAINSLASRVPSLSVSKLVKLPV